MKDIPHSLLYYLNTRLIQLGALIPSHWFFARFSILVHFEVSGEDWRGIFNLCNAVYSLSANNINPALQIYNSLSRAHWHFPQLGTTSTASPATAAGTRGAGTPSTTPGTSRTCRPWRSARAAASSSYRMLGLLLRRLGRSRILLKTIFLGNWESF